MSRHSRALQGLADRVHDGEIGEIILHVVTACTGPADISSPRPKRPVSATCSPGEALPQLHGGVEAGFSEILHIHIIDHAGQDLRTNGR